MNGSKSCFESKGSSDVALSLDSMAVSLYSGSKVKQVSFVFICAASV